MARKYQIILYWTEEDRAYLAEVSGLPGCTADGKTYQEALAMAEQIIEEWIETAKAIGREIPKPRGPVNLWLTDSSQGKPAIDSLAKGRLSDEKTQGSEPLSQQAG